MPTRFAPLALLLVTSCLVPGLEVGEPEPGTAGKAAVTLAGAGGAAGNPFATGGADAGGSPFLAGTSAGGAGAGGGAVVGSAGAEPAALRCADLPISSSGKWKATAFTSRTDEQHPSDPLNNPAAYAFDGTVATRWSSGQAQEEEGQWFQLDFGHEVAVSEVTLRLGSNLDDYPRGYAISFSNKWTDFEKKACVTGKGVSVSEAVIPLGRAERGQFMMIRQTGAAMKWWSIAEISVACHD